MALADVPADLMRQVPAGAKPVDAIPGPNGQGWYVLGSDGGVFALGGAPYLGGYQDANMAGARNDPTRTFSGIMVNAQGGYTLLSNKSEHYNFNPPQAPTPTANVPVTPPVAPTPTGPTTQQTTTATGFLHSLLDPLGLGALVDKSMNWAIESGNDANYVLEKIRLDPIYTTAFPEMGNRQKNGLPAISEADILNYRATAKGILQSYGMPANALSDQDISNFISTDVSPAEISDRVQKGYVAAMQAPPEYRQALAQLGVGQGDLAHFFLDPTKAYDSIMNKAAVGASALEQGYGALTNEEMGQLAGAGVTAATANQRFGNLYNQRQLFNNLPGEADAGVSRQDQIAYAQGLAPAEEELANAAKKRVAAFGGGGGYAAGSGGVSGLGSANG